MSTSFRRHLTSFRCTVSPSVRWASCPSFSRNVQIRSSYHTDLQRGQPTCPDISLMYEKIIQRHGMKNLCKEIACLIKFHLVISRCEMWHHYSAAERIQVRTYRDLLQAKLTRVQLFDQQQRSAWQVSVFLWKFTRKKLRKELATLGRQGSSWHG